MSRARGEGYAEVLVLAEWVSELTREGWGGITLARKAEGITTMLQPLRQTTFREPCWLAT